MLLRPCSPAVRQSTINYAGISLCWNQFWQQFKETDTSGAAGCEGGKNLIRFGQKQPFYFLLQISNWADLWGNLWVQHKAVKCPFRLNRLRWVPKRGARMELFLVFALLEMVLMSAGARGESVRPHLRFRLRRSQNPSELICFSGWENQRSPKPERGLRVPSAVWHVDISVATSPVWHI